MTKLLDKVVGLFVPKATVQARCAAPMARNCGACNFQNLRICCWIEGSCQEVCVWEICG